MQRPSGPTHASEMSLSPSILIMKGLEGEHHFALTGRAPLSCIRARPDSRRAVGGQPPTILYLRAHLSSASSTASFQSALEQTSQFADWPPKFWTMSTISATHSHSNVALHLRLFVKFSYSPPPIISGGSSRLTKCFDITPCPLMSFRDFIPH